MTLTWTDDMGALDAAPAIDAAARRAVVAAVSFLDNLPPSPTRDQMPYWTLGSTASARNQVARDMEAAIVAAAGAISADARLRVVANAVRYALFAANAGRGAAAWEALRALRVSGAH